MPAYPLSLPRVTPTTHFLGLSMDNSSIIQCSFFPISPLHPLLCIVLSALSFLVVADRL